ncbi:MAG: XRE family transcriptional regulator [Actinomycetota bacterium]
MSKFVSFEELTKSWNLDEKKLRKGVQQLLALVDGVKMAELRQVKRLTQSQMAKKLKIDQSNVSRIERGRFDSIEIRTLRRYIEALGGELEIRVKIDDVSQRLIDSEYEKKMVRKFARKEALRVKKKMPAKARPRTKSVAKRRPGKRVTTRALSSRKSMK